MVFESLVADLLNRFLGDYVENLDSSQLSIGIWGGDVVLENLFLKGSALDDLDLPVKLFAGSLGKLTLKIPWKNLYTEPVIANIEGLSILVTPNKGVAYNAEKEEKNAWDAKQKQLQAIEDTRLREMDKDKPKDEKQDSFAEKMVTQVIKNLQVTVKDIHVRYEDKFSNPKCPFSCGVTLHNLSFQTTDTDWKPTIIKETVTMIYKLVELDCLSMYWNSDTKCYSDLNRGQLLNSFKKNIATSSNTPDLQYILHPINSKAHLKLHTKPEQDNFSIPKVLLSLVMEEIAIALSRNQYLDVMEFLEGLERMGRSALYQKFHPGAGVPIKGNAKKYWHFAMNSIMEDVRRRLRQKSWMHIADHRKRVKAYQAAYKKKLLAKKVSKELQTELDGCEKSLDVLNITLARQQARTEVTREEAKNENKGGWLSGWWGGGKKEEKAAKGTTEEIAEKFGEAMTPEEKAKLFDAIGYSENQVDTTLPQEFVAMQLKFHLKNLSVSLKEPTRKSPQIIKLAFTDAVANVDQRPSAEAIKVDASIASMAVYGVPAGDSVPHLVTTRTDGAGGGAAANLLSVMFETNPLDKACDQRVKLLARPLEIVYNAATINQVADFFKPPESVHLSQLQAAAASKLDELKEMSATGLQHAVEHHKYMDLNIDIQPSYVIVPENGVYSDSAHLLVLDLGALTMRSVKDKRPMLPRVGSTEKEVMDDLKSRSYDKFDIALQRVQVMFAEPGNDWKVARGEADSSLQLLKPFDLNVQLHKGLIVDDPRLPKVRVLSELPNLAIFVSDHKLQQIARLAASIPTPEPAAAPPAEAVVPDAVAVDDGDAERIARRAAAVAAAAKKKQEGPAEQLTDIELRFELRRFAVSVCRRVETHDVGIVAIAVEGVVVEAAVRTYEMRVGARVGGVSVRHLQFNGADGAPVALVGTPAAGRDDVDLVSATYVRANRAGPEFATTYGNAEQAVAVTFSRLDVTMHRGALLHLMQFGKDFGEKMAAAVPSKPEVAAPPPPDDAGAPKPIAAAASRTTLAAVPLSEERRRRLEEIIELQLEARLGSIAVSLCDDDGAVAALTLSGLHAGVTMRRESIAVAASLRDVVVADPTPGAAHPRIVSTVGGEELLSAHVRQYAHATDGDAYADMDAADLVVELSVAQLRVVVLARFLGDVAAFAAAFQSEAAQRAIADAGAAAAESAAEAATNLQSKATRVRLDVSVSAPVIVVPRSSSALEAIVADLGCLTARNRFVVTGATDVNGLPSILDKMLVELNRLQLTRVRLDAAGGCVAECALIAPVNVSIELRRNLCAAWYRDIPEIDVGGQATALDATLSQEDFTFVMAVLNENLQEGPTRAPAPEPLPELTQRELVEKSVVAKSEKAVAAAVAEAKTVAVEAKTVAVEAKTVAAEPTATVVVASDADSPHERVCFKFQFDRLSFSLYTGSSGLMAGAAARDPAKALARFELQVMTAEGTLMSDNAVSARVGLYNCVMDDMRSGRETGITRLMEARAAAAHDGPGHHNLRMIDVSFAQTPASDKRVDVSVRSFYVCVVMDYLLTVADFFTKGLPAAPAPAPVAPGKPAAAGKKEETAAKPAKEVPTSSFELKFTMEKPEIALVEDARDRGTRALVVDTDVALSVRVSPDGQQVSGSIERLRVVACPHDPVARAASVPATIVQPCDITLFASAPTAGGQKVDVAVGDLVVAVSPATIRTVSGIVAAMGQAEPADAAHEAPIELGALWQARALADCDFWYLRGAEEAAEVTEEEATEEDAAEDEEERGEQLLLRVASIVVRVEAGGVGARTLPMLTLESSLTAEAHEWSGALQLAAVLTAEMAFYNERLAVWEPLLEPVEDTAAGSGTGTRILRPWEINLHVDKNPAGAGPTTPDDPDMEVVVSRPVGLAVNVVSMDVMQLCVTKTCLDVLASLGRAFGDAVSLKEEQRRGEEVVDAPCVVRNATGVDFVVAPGDSFEPPQGGAAGGVTVRHGGVLPLEFRAPAAGSPKKHQSQLRASVRPPQHELTLRAGPGGDERRLSVARAGKRLFALPGGAAGEAFVAQVDAADGQKQVTLRAPVRVRNHLAVAMETHYKVDGRLVQVGTIAPDETFDPPLAAVYSADANFYFAPLGGDGFSPSNAFNWRQERGDGNDAAATLECPSTKSGHVAFYVAASCEAETDVVADGNAATTTAAYTLHLRPTVLLTNLLPYAVAYMLPGTDGGPRRLEAGVTAPLHHARVADDTAMELTLADGMTQGFSGRVELRRGADELALLTFRSDDGRETAHLGVHTRWVGGTMHLAVYSPFWMVNKTGRTLRYQGTEGVVATHTADRQEALLFSFGAKDFFAKKKATLRVDDSEWSDKFSLDTVGSSGKVACKGGSNGGSGACDIAVSISMTSFGLSKVVVFTPYFMLMNKAPYDVDCKEFITGAEWTTVPAGACLPFYPRQTDKIKQMVARVTGVAGETKPFLCNKLHETLMRLDNAYGGVDVDCQVNESSTIIAFDRYHDGAAPTRVVNHCDGVTVEYAQRGVEGVPCRLAPRTTALFVWQDALELKRELQWSCGERKNQVNALQRDAVEELFANTDTKVYFASFLDGMQRVVMFTQDLVLATMAQQAGELEAADMDATVALNGFGLSLIDDTTRTDVCYVSLTSSGVIWETKRKRFKGMKLKESEIVERHYQKYLADVAAGRKAKPRVHTENKMEIDFAEMALYKPRKCRVRRTYQHGVWLNARASAHSTQLHAKLQHVQVDNQLPASAFAVVLAPVPPPRSVAAESVPKPFVELSVMKRNVEHSDVQQIKYFKVLIQEMALQADQGFINGMLAMFAPGVDVPLYEPRQMEADRAVTHVDLRETLATTVLAAGPRNYYDLLHFSPLKVHISFSQGGTAAAANGRPAAPLHANVVGLLLKSVGVTVTEIQDVVFKLAYFERESAFYTQVQLQAEATMHYVGQAVKQLYVLVLGLDVLGNPFGLITGVKDGVTDLFYEPMQGVVQGPEEFAEGLALGVRSLFGGVVGGAAGAVGRITGTLGKGLAALTLDDDYQRKRQEQLNKRPANLKSGLAQGGKGLVMGVWDGVSGVVLKPVEGAKQEGAAGFFKGAGKGLIGLVARPTSGVVDFASTSLESIRKATDMSEEVRRQRPPRMIHADGVIRPYQLREAEGNQILQDVSKGKFAKTDTYVSHLVLDLKELKYILLVTDKRVVMVNKGELFGQWVSDWTYTWEELKEAPTCHDHTIKVILKEPKKKKLGLFGSGMAGKSVSAPDHASAEWITRHLAESYAAWKAQQSQ